MGRGTLLAMVLAAACMAEHAADGGTSTGPEGASTVVIDPEAASSGGEGSSSSGAAPGLPDTRRCIPPEGVNAAPRTVEDARLLLNSLPPPVDIACFLESLDRPLKIHATNSTFSAQPAFNADNPRIFIFSGELIMSVVPDGEGTHLLEFGEFVDDFQTLKAEVELPAEGPFSPSDPYSRIRFGEGTGCGLCHHNEHEVGTVDGVSQFASLAFQPALHHALEEADVRAAHAACEEQDTRRCLILKAIFDHDPVLFTVFPEDLPTFGG